MGILQTFTSKQLELLDLEKQAELEESQSISSNIPEKFLEKNGSCILKLKITKHKIGLYGRLVVKLQRANSAIMPMHSFSNGDIAALFESNNPFSTTTEMISGIVYKSTDSFISLAIDPSIELDTLKQYKILKLPSDVTHKRLKKCIKQLGASEYSSRLVTHFFGDELLSIDRICELDVQFLNETLDNSQKAAVSFALSHPYLAIIHGPPGTGKTTTVIEIIHHMVQLGLKILVCAPSNIAVDNLVEKLVNAKVPCVRLGHPARVATVVKKRCLDALLAKSDEGGIISDVRKEIGAAIANVSQKKGFRNQTSLKDLRSELKQRVRKATQSILKGCSVVAATCTSAGDDSCLMYLPDGYFDVAVIDECSQSLESACWIPLLRAKKCVLAGDHFQLPPTIISHQAAKGGLEKTLMERLIDRMGDQTQFVRMLSTQYRMHHLIMDWSSQTFYDGKLEAHDSVAGHLLKDLPEVQETDDTGCPLLLIDTSGCGLSELSTPLDVSKGNPGEADIVAHHCKQLCEAGVKPSEIAIISAYNLQVELIRNRIHPHYPTMEIKSVDGFQGREKEAVILSLVRSNDSREVGFLSETRRINVAITRARRHLCVVCDSQTVNADEKMSSLMEYFHSFGEVRSAHDYMQFVSAVQDDVLLDAPLVGKEKSERRKIKSRPTKNDKPEIKVRQPPSTSVSPVYSQFRDEKREELKSRVISFVTNSDELRLAFESTLTAADRAFVHELSETMDLKHESETIDSQRFIVISKYSRTEEVEPVCEEENDDLVEAASPGIVVEHRENETQTLLPPHNMERQPKRSLGKLCKKPNPTHIESKTCENCKKAIPVSNYQLHTLRCPAKVEQEDDFEVLEAAARLNSVCNFDGCKTKVKTLGSDCQFCRFRYCLTHGLPEVHGCGDMVKQHARRMVVREGRIYPGLGVPSKKPSSDKRNQLERKMGKKLDELSGARKRKGGGSKKK